MNKLYDLLHNHILRSHEQKDAFMKGFLIGRGITDIDDMSNFRIEEDIVPDEHPFKVKQKLYYHNEQIAEFTQEINFE